MARNGFFLVLVALETDGLSDPLPSAPPSEGSVRFPFRARYSLIMVSNSFCVVIRNT